MNNFSNTPQIDGLSFRIYRDKSDLPKMVFVREKSKVHDQVDPLSTLESTPSIQDLADSLEDNNCEPVEDILLIEVNSEMIGYAKIGWWTENDGTQLYLHSGFLVPEWRGKGVGSAMLDWSQNRLREIANAEPKSGKKMFGSNATSTEIEKTKLLLDDGYKKVFTEIEMGFDMQKDLPDIQFPVGFEIRPVKPVDVKKIWEANNEVYRDRDFVTLPTEEDFKEFAENPNNDFSLWQIAWSDNEIAALVLSEVNGTRGEIKEVSTIQKFRRKGLALALLVKNLIILKGKKVDIIRLHTNGENASGARTLYEKMGFKHLKDDVRYRKPLS